MAVAINPDPHAKGYHLSPTHLVRGMFSSPPIEEVLQGLHDGGFADDEISVFVGTQGAQQLDLSAQHHGPGRRLLRDLERIFVADDTEFHDKADRFLQGGGCAIDVVTGGDNEKKERAVQVFKAHRAEEIVYWGRLIVERM